MIIRQGMVTDIFELSRLWLQMVKELCPQFAPNVSWWRELAQKCFQGGNYFVLVAEIDNKIIGFIDWFMYPEPSTGKIHAVGQHFFVIPEERKKSISGTLYKKMMNISKKQGAQITELFCFDKEINFWKNHKFNPIRSMLRREGA